MIKFPQMNLYPFLIIILVIISVIFIVNSDPKSPVNIQKEKLLISPTPNMTNLKIEDIKIGTGPEVKVGDTISIHYVGTLENGKKFDSSRDRGTPFETQIGVGQVIKGWDEGVIGMKVGGQRKLTIPPELGYGAQEIPGVIPANSTLIFDVELVAIK